MKNRSQHSVTRNRDRAATTERAVRPPRAAIRLPCDRIQAPRLKLPIAKLVRLFTASALMMGAGIALSSQPPPNPVKIIFDTDVGNDCDDVMALAVIHALQNRNACRLLAVTLTNPDPLAGKFVDAINTFYGRPDILIGVNPSAPIVRKVSSYLKAAGNYPHDFDPANAPATIAVLRETLASAHDGEVVIVQVGFFTNLARLIESPADAICPLPGRELVRRKVRQLSLMAGTFGPVRGHNYFIEFNVKRDIPAAIRVAAEWPTPAVWSGMEIGLDITFPALVIERDFSYVSSHPVQESYRLYRAMPHDRPCYDLTSVLHAIWPDRDYFELSAPGTVEIQPDGFTRFKPVAVGRDRHLIVDRERAGRVREVFAALVTEPPMGELIGRHGRSR